MSSIHHSCFRTERRLRNARLSGSHNEDGLNGFISGSGSFRVAADKLSEWSLSQNIIRLSGATASSVFKDQGQGRIKSLKTERRPFSILALRKPGLIQTSPLFFLKKGCYDGHFSLTDTLFKTDVSERLNLIVVSSGKMFTFVHLFLLKKKKNSFDLRIQIAGMQQ